MKNYKAARTRGHGNTPTDQEAYIVTATNTGGKIVKFRFPSNALAVDKKHSLIKAGFTNVSIKKPS